MRCQYKTKELVDIANNKITKFREYYESAGIVSSRIASLKTDIDNDIMRLRSDAAKYMGTVKACIWILEGLVMELEAHGHEEYCIHEKFTIEFEEFMGRKDRIESPVKAIFDTGNEIVEFYKTIENTAVLKYLSGDKQ